MKSPDVMLPKREESSAVVIVLTTMGVGSSMTDMEMRETTRREVDRGAESPVVSDEREGCEDLWWCARKMRGTQIGRQKPGRYFSRRQHIVKSNGQNGLH
jgi:hypothetical protein